MKLEILKEHLESAVSIAARVSNKNLSLPVLGCVIISVEESRAVVRATNLDVSVEVVLKGKILEPGVVAVPASVLLQTVSTATDQKIILSADNTKLTFKGERGSAHINTVDASDFPTLPFVKEGEGVAITLPSKELVRALKSVSFAASTSGMRPELSSIFLILEEGMMTTAATDSFRLGEYKAPIKIKTSSDPILIPARNVADIIRILSEDETAELRRGDNQVTVICGGSYLTSRTIDGVFPEYQAIIPTSFSTTATALTEDVLRALRKVSVFADATNQVTVSVSPTKKTFTVRAANTQVGDTEENIEAALQGEEVTINFNVRYILDALGAVVGDSVTFKIAGPGKPMIITDTPDRGFTYLVMPMNK